MKKLMLVINPAAGRGGFRNLFGDAMLQLSAGDILPSLYFTRAPGEATELTKKYASDYDMIACVGGDGTLSEVVAGLMQLPAPPVLGYIPMGTSNDVATTLGIPKNDTVGAARRIVEGKAHAYDIGGFGDHDYFAYIAAFGAFTEVSYVTPQDQKKALGHLAYILQGASLLGKIEKIHTKIEYDDGVFEGDLLYGSMSNSTSVAGIVRLRDEMVSIGDGKSELVLVMDPITPDAYGELAGAILSRTFDNPNLLILHTTKAKFSFDRPVSWTRDGEAGGSHASVELCNYHAALQFIF